MPGTQNLLGFVEVTDLVDDTIAIKEEGSELIANGPYCDRLPPRFQRKIRSHRELVVDSKLFGAGFL